MWSGRWAAAGGITGTRAVEGMLSDEQVTVELSRESGKFAGRDELAEQLMEALESADPGSIDGVGADGESTYNIDMFEVEEVQRRK